MNLWGHAWIFLSRALLLNVWEQPTNEYEQISGKCLTWESCHNLHGVLQNYSVRSWWKKITCEINASIFMTRLGSSSVTLVADRQMLDKNNNKQYTYCSLIFSFVLFEFSSIPLLNCILYGIYLFSSLAVSVVDPCRNWYSEMKSSMAVWPDKAETEKENKEWSEGLQG